MVDAVESTKKDSVNLPPIAIDCNRVFTCFESQLSTWPPQRQLGRPSARQKCPQCGQLNRRDVATHQSQLLASRDLLTRLNQADPVMQTHFMLTPQSTKFNRFGVGRMCGCPVLA